jgi:hypothetical protein
MEERSVTRRTALPLVAVAATFFLPMVDSCKQAVSPLTYVAGGGVGPALWVLPTFVTAAVLAVAVFRSWRAKARTALAFAAMGAFALTLPVLGVIFGVDGAYVMAPIYGAATLATLLLLKRARAKGAWERLSALLDAYAVAAFPLAVTITALAKYAGAYAFVIAYVAFATQRGLVALQSVRGRRRTRDARAVDGEAVAADLRLRVAGNAGGNDELHARIGPQEDLSLDAADEDVPGVRSKAASS